MPRVRLAVLGPLGLVALAAPIGGCALESPPITLEVADVQPHEVEVGEHLEIDGRGFPVGRTARVSLRGEAHRAGQEPVQVRADVDAIAESQEHLDLAVTDALAGPLCGVGDGASHATFRGELTVTFPPAQPGTAPLVGRAGQVVLDVRPSESSPLVRRRAEAEGRRTLMFLGVEIADRLPATGGILIAGVAPGSRAEAAGLHAGEVIAEVDEVRVSSLADAVPVGGHAATLVVGAPLGGEARTVRVSVEGLKPRISPEVLRAGLAVVAPLALLAALLWPSSGALGWLERRGATRLRGKRVPRGRREVQSLVEWWLAALDRWEARGLAGLGERWGAPALATLAFVALPLLETIGGFDFDVVTPYASAAFLVAALAFAGARAADGRWSTGAALASAGRALALELPSALGAACVVASSGSLRLSDASRTQAGAPWAWALFRSPATFAAFVVAAAMAIPSRTREPSTSRALPEAEATSQEPSAARHQASRAADEASRYAFAALGAALYCGGWELPGLGAFERDAWWGFPLIGAGLFVLKAWGLAAAIGALRGALPRLSGAALASVGARRVLPALAFVVAATAGWLLWHPSRGAAHAVQVATFGVAVAIAFAIGARLLHAATTITARHVDPRA